MTEKVIPTEQIEQGSSKNASGDGGGATAISTGAGRHAPCRQAAGKFSRSLFQRASSR